MNKRLFLNACTLASLPLALMPAAAQAPAVQSPDTPAMAVIREFLADRAAGKSADAYGLLTRPFREKVPESAFAAGDKMPAMTLKQKSEPIFGLGVLFRDVRNTQGYTFSIISSDPADPNTVLVRATPPASAAGVSATVLRLVTVSDPSTYTPRLDIVESLKRTVPELPRAAANNARRAESLNNLRQIGLGIVQYEQDHDEVAPDAAHWVDEVMPYVRSTGPFRDPSAPASQLYSYAYNRAFSHKTLAEMEVPERSVIVFESTKGVKNASDTGQSIPHPGRHEGGSDYLFADGHAEWFKDGTTLSFKLSGK